MSRNYLCRRTIYISEPMRLLLEEKTLKRVYQRRSILRLLRANSVKENSDKKNDEILSKDSLTELRSEMREGRLIVLLAKKNRM